MHTMYRYIRDDSFKTDVGRYKEALYIYFTYYLISYNRVKTKKFTIDCKAMKLLILLLFINICNGFLVREISNKVKRQLEPNFLCSIGPSPLSARAEVSFRARQGVVYVDPTRPATCNGRVNTIETCFEINDNIAENFPSFDLINLRPHAGGYQLQLSLVIPINEITEDENSHLISLYCQNITVPSAFTVRKGDLIGFRSWNNIEIAFTFFPFEGSLRSVRLEPVLGVETVQADDLRVDSKNDSELPMFRVFIGKLSSSFSPHLKYIGSRKTLTSCKCGRIL